MSESRDPPPLCLSNSNRLGTAGEIAFSNGSRTWTERFDLVVEAAAALKSRGHTVTAHKAWLVHGDSGFTIQPQLGVIQPLDDGGVRTMTTLQVNHPTLIQSGVFEYQHATGDTVVESLAKGFDQWVQMDFVTLLDALRAKPEHCTTMEMTFPAMDGKPERVRRAVLGPCTHMSGAPPDASQEHPFCPCCLLTNSFKAFEDLIEADAFYGLRLFAMRDRDGTRSADCRVNGDDWERGAQALRNYVSTWPPAGFEMRKQYVVLQTVEHGSGAGLQQA
jgi:Family of unknown function (DUF6348)